MNLTDERIRELLAENVALRLTPEYLAPCASAGTRRCAIDGPHTAAAHLDCMDAELRADLDAR